MYGGAPPTEIRICRPNAKNVRWWRPETEPVTLTARPGAGDEVVVTIPPLPGMQPGTLTLPLDLYGLTP